MSNAFRAVKDYTEELHRRHSYRHVQGHIHLLSSSTTTVAAKEVTHILSFAFKSFLPHFEILLTPALKKEEVRVGQYLIHKTDSMIIRYFLRVDSTLERRREGLERERLTCFPC